jgi:CheY-like chemotaxis protein
MLAVNEEMRRAKEEAEAANGAKSEFLSRMSHELRTPLNAILGFGQLLELEEDKEENRESVEQILKAGRHLLSLIDEVLDLARIEAGRMSLSMEPTSVRQAVQQSLDLIRPMASQRGIRIVAEASTDCDLHVSADLQRLKQVLLNFLSNAIKYNREGGSVTISCVPHPMEGRVRIAVRDTGVGIEPAKLNRLFTPFERLDAERTDVEGTGLGLALSRGLMEAMGGVVGAESTRDEGSTFWLELPIVTEPALPEEAAPADVASATALGKQGHTVLYVEDNLSNLRLVERILTRRPDVQLLVALQGRIALELARQHRPDLILLDVHLPDLNGDAVLAELQRDPVLREIPVVVVSADATSGQIERLRRSGARDYLTKPLDVKRFLDVLDSTLDSVRAV